MANPLDYLDWPDMVSPLPADDPHEFNTPVSDRSPDLQANMESMSRFTRMWERANQPQAPRNSDPSLYLPSTPRLNQGPQVVPTHEFDSYLQETYPNLKPKDRQTWREYNSYFPPGTQGETEERFNTFMNAQGIKPEDIMPEPESRTTSATGGESDYHPDPASTAQAFREMANEFIEAQQRLGQPPQSFEDVVDRFATLLGGGGLGTFVGRRGARDLFRTTNRPGAHINDIQAMREPQRIFEEITRLERTTRPTERIVEQINERIRSTAYPYNGVPFNDVFGGVRKWKDGNWSLELSDASVRINRDFDSVWNNITVGEDVAVSLSDLVDGNSPLLRMYPRVANMDVVVHRIAPNQNNSIRGMAWGNDLHVFVSDPKDIRNILLHEWQHPIQDIERWSGGGTTGRSWFRLPEETAGVQSQGFQPESLIGSLLSGDASAFRTMAHAQLPDYVQPIAESLVVERMSKAFPLFRGETLDDVAAFLKDKNIQPNSLNLTKLAEDLDFEIYRRHQGEVQARLAHERANQRGETLRTSRVEEWQEYYPEDQQVVGPTGRVGLSVEPSTPRRVGSRLALTRDLLDSIPSDSRPITGFFNQQMPHLVAEDHRRLHAAIIKQLGEHQLSSAGLGERTLRGITNNIRRETGYLIRPAQIRDYVSELAGVERPYTGWHHGRIISGDVVDELDVTAPLPRQIIESDFSKYTPQQIQSLHTALMGEIQSYRGRPEGIGETELKEIRRRIKENTGIIIRPAQIRDYISEMSGNPRVQQQSFEGESQNRTGQVYDETTGQWSGGQNENIQSSAFVGRSAQLPPGTPTIEDAERLEASGDYDTLDIYMRTGWWRGSNDNQWRREAFAETFEMSLEGMSELSETTLGAVLPNATIYNMYPGLENTIFKFANLFDKNTFESYVRPSTVRGMTEHANGVVAIFDEDSGNIVFNTRHPGFLNKLRDVQSAKTPEEKREKEYEFHRWMLEILYHEIQHKIQKAEGYELPSNTRNPISSAFLGRPWEAAAQDAAMRDIFESTRRRTPESLREGYGGANAAELRRIYEERERRRNAQKDIRDFTTTITKNK